MTPNWTRHTFAQRTWRPQNQAVALLILGIMLGLIFGGVYLSQVASYATMNRHIEGLLAERDSLEFTNEQLRAQIANLQTLPRLYARAQELGFRLASNTDMIHLRVTGYNPNRQPSVIATPITEEYRENLSYGATFSGWLEQQLDLLRQQFSSFGR